MGVSTWTQSLMQSDGAELQKPPPPTRRSHQQSELLKCPRCDSTNTKFCYYNNYNKSQPRHFCKACKRHWTKGGTLRNVPVGGGRKNKRLKTSNASSTTKASGAATTNPTTNPTTPSILTFGAFGTADNISSFSGKSFTGNNGSAPKDQNPEFQFSGLSTFDIDSSSLLIPAGNAYDYAGNCLDAAEESTITTVNPSTSSSVIEFPWGDPSTDTAMDLPNYYWNNWNDIDLLTSADLINISWDDTEIKP